MKYRDLPLGSQLAFTIWDAYAPRKAIPLGGTTFRLFGKYKYVPLLILAKTWIESSCQFSTLKQGKHKLYVWPWQEADGLVNTSTPSKVDTASDMDRLEKVSVAIG